MKLTIVEEVLIGKDPEINKLFNLSLKEIFCAILFTKNRECD